MPGWTQERAAAGRLEGEREEIGMLVTFHQCWVLKQKQQTLTKWLQ